MLHVTCSHYIRYLNLLYINNSRHLARKYARIFVRSFSRAKLEENSELQGTGNVQGQYPSIFLLQMEAIVFIILQIFFETRAIFKIGEYLTIRLRARVFYEQIVNEAQPS